MARWGIGANGVVLVEAHDHVVSNHGPTSGVALDALAGRLAAMAGKLPTLGQRHAQPPPSSQAQAQVTPVACTGQ